MVPYKHAETRIQGMTAFCSSGWSVSSCTLDKTEAIFPNNMKRQIENPQRRTWLGIYFPECQTRCFSSICQPCTFSTHPLTGWIVTLITCLSSVYFSSIREIAIVFPCWFKMTRKTKRRGQITSEKDHKVVFSSFNRQANYSETKNVTIRCQMSKNKKNHPAMAV